VAEVKRPVTLTDILGGHAVLDIQCLDRIYLSVTCRAFKPAGRRSGSCTIRASRSPHRPRSAR